MDGGLADNALVMKVGIRRWQWLLAWLGGALIGVGNGVAREATLARFLGEKRAHQASCVSGVAAFAAYFHFLQRSWPLCERDEALKIGGAWLTMTVAFEFGFGRLAAKKPLRELVEDYNVAKGRLWPVVLAWIAVGPEITRRRAPA